MKNIELMREYMRLVEAGEKEPWKSFELKTINSVVWTSMSRYSWFNDDDLIYRYKPKTININGFEVPEPAKEPLPVGSEYFIAYFYNKQLCMHRIWYDDESDAMLLVSGVVHKTKEAAIQHAKALLSFTAKGED